MRDRIKAIMEAENMTPARFADTLDIGRAVISHILNGRNNPSLDVITRILAKLPQINSDWLLTGNGNMHKNANASNIQQPTLTGQADSIINFNNPAFPDLFSQIPSDNSVNTTNGSEKDENRKENIVNHSQKELHEIVNERIIYKESVTKKVRQIIIYYSDNTFETFSHE